MVVSEILKYVYDRIVQEMQLAVFEQTGQQCRDKMKKLRSEYHKLKTVIVERVRAGASGNSLSTWMLF